MSLLGGRRAAPFGGTSAAGPPQGTRPPWGGGASAVRGERVPQGRPKARAPWGERRAAPFGGNM